MLSKIETSLMKYDPIADEWVQRASLDKNRCGFGCTVFNQMLYVVGGCDDFPHPDAFVDGNVDVDANVDLASTDA